MSITLPVSLGEAIDKLSILDIKLRRIADNRRNDVAVEHAMLYSQLEEYVNQHRFYYDKLVSINEGIWNDQDVLRSTGTTLSVDAYARMCTRILDMNDMRFRLKNKINLLAQSNLKEQKGYAIKKAMIVSHAGLGDIINQIGAIRYLSLIYDKIFIFIHERNRRNIELFIGNDPNIEYLARPELLNYSHQQLLEFAKEYDCELLAGGCHKGSGQEPLEIPFSFYKDMGVPVSTFRDYFFVPEYDEQQKYLDIIFEKTNKIAFVHLTGSNRQITYDKPMNDDTFYCNPCQSMYKPGDKFYDLSMALVGHPLVMFKKIIEAASEIYVIDSSFSCFAGLLDTSKAGNNRTLVMHSSNAGIKCSDGVMAGFTVV